MRSAISESWMHCMGRYRRWSGTTGFPFFHRLRRCPACKASAGCFGWASRKCGALALCQRVLPGKNEPDCEDGWNLCTSVKAENMSRHRRIRRISEQKVAKIKMLIPSLKWNYIYDKSPAKYEPQSHYVVDAINFILYFGEILHSAEAGKMKELRVNPLIERTRGQYSTFISRRRRTAAHSKRKGTRAPFHSVIPLIQPVVSLLATKALRAVVTVCWKRESNFCTFRQKPD